MTVAPPSAVDDGLLPLSAALRAATAVAHERAEGSAFVSDLLGGAHPIDAYVALVAQNHAIYTALEEITPRWRGSAVAGPFVIEALSRRPSLAADLAVLLGPGWRDAAADMVQPATVAYVGHLHQVAGTWDAGFVAHHYVRYLGDLSGGQVVGRRVGELFGTRGAAATSFYRFDEIPKIKPFRDDYRARLDSVSLGAIERSRMLEEAVVAFELNRSVFVELGGLFRS